MRGAEHVRSEIVLDFGMGLWYYGTMDAMPEWELAAIMPRKAKPPAYTVHIEGLSKPNQVKDDLSDAMISVPQARVPSHAELQRAQAQLKLQASQRILALMWPEPKPRSNAKPGERSIKLGQGHELIFPPKPWRRV